MIEIRNPEKTKILGVYDSKESAAQEGFKVVPKSEKIGDYFWSESSENNGPGNLDSLIIVQTSKETGEVRGYYKTLAQINKDQFNTTSLSRTLLKPADPGNREYKGYVWYRLWELEDRIPAGVRAEIIESDPLERTEIKILLTLSGKIISVNDLYKARISYVAGRPVPVIYKNPKAKVIGEEIRNQLSAVDFTRYVPWLTRTTRYEVYANFVLKSGIKSRDLSNLEKNIGDELVKFMTGRLGIEHFDDSEFYEYKMAKSIMPGAKKEYVYLVLRESFFNYNMSSSRSDLRWYLCSGPSLVSPSIYDPRTNRLNPDRNKLEESRLCNAHLWVVDENTDRLKLISGLYENLGKIKAVVFIGTVDPELREIISKIPKTYTGTVKDETGILDYVRSIEKSIN